VKVGVVTFEVRVIATGDEEQIDFVRVVFVTPGTGNTVMSKVVGFPLQPSAVAIMV
jgi:hypothetical protein